MSKTAKKNKKKNLEIGMEELDILAAMDYVITEFSEYHWRINDKLDVWPSSKKWWSRGGHRGGKYEELVPFVIEFFQVKYV